jgi:hypothetical protein
MVETLGSRAVGVRVRPLLWATVGLAALAAVAFLAPDASAQMPPTPPPAPAPTNCVYNIDNNIPFNWVDISGNGTGMSAWTGDTETAWISHSPPFYGFICNQYGNNFQLSSKGHFCVSMSTLASSVPGCGNCCDAPGPIPSLGNARPALWGFYADLDPGLCPNGNGGSCIFHKTFGTAPNRWFVYQFEDVPYYSASANRNTFQMRLFEATGCIETHYKSTTVSGTSWPRNGAGYNGNGGTAAGWQYFYNPSGQALANVAWKACPRDGLPPLCTPTTTTVAPGPATFNAQFGQGPYTWSVSPTAGVAPASGSGTSFTATFVAQGTYTVTVTGANGASSTCTLTVVLPACGYSMTPIPIAWEDISGTGSPIGHGDLSTLTLNLNAQVPPMPFQFCGTTYTSLRLVSKGYICFVPTVNCATAFSGCCAIPSASMPRPAIFGYYADIVPRNCQPSGGTSCTFWQILGSPGSRRLVYEFRNANYWASGSGPGMTQPDTNGPVSFEIKLFEGSNCFEVHYLRINPGWGGRVIAGFQNPSGTSAWAYWNSAPGFNTEGSPAPAGPRAWRACPEGAVGDAYLVNEDQGPVTLNVMANDNLGGSPYTFIGNTWPTKGSLVPTATPGVFTYMPFPHVTGTDSFTYTIQKVGGILTSTATVTLTIQPVNDPPSFVIPQPRLLFRPEDGPQAVPGWASVVLPGPPAATDEAMQGITFALVENSEPTLFLGAPTLERTATASATTPVSPNTSGSFGVLKFKPSGNWGMARLCFVAVDTGGKATVTDTWGTKTTGNNTSAKMCGEIVMNAPPVAFFKPSAPSPGARVGITFDPCPGPAPECTMDPDGPIDTWLWEFGDGTTRGGQGDVHGPTHAYATPGTYVVRLTVWDVYATSATYAREVEVVWPESAPADQAGATKTIVADAGPDRTVLEGTAVRLEGTQTGGGEGTVFEWTQVDGPSTTLEDGATSTPTFTAPAVELKGATLVFALRVAEGTARSEPDYVAIHVASAEQAPVADAGGTITVYAGEVVRLGGPGTGDPDGDELTLRWEQVLQPGDVAVKLSDAGAATPTFRAASPGVLQFRLTASDGRATAVDHAVVHVLPALPEGAAEAAAGGSALVQPVDAPTPTAEGRGGVPFAALAGFGILLLVAVLLALLLARRLRR